MLRFDAEGYKVTESYDRDSWVVAFATTKAVAEQIAKEKNAVYRSVSPFKTTTIVYESLQEYRDAQAKTFREQALAKLTPQERTALGL